MRIFKNKWFARFERKSEISDFDLCRAVQDAVRGLIDADLGGGVITAVPGLVYLEGFSPSRCDHQGAATSYEFCQGTVILEPL
jgi:hypothetical protein